MCIKLVILSLKKFSLYVILKLCAEFQFPTMPATGQKVCGGGGGGGRGGVVGWWWWWWLRPTLVFSLAKAEQFLKVDLNPKGFDLKLFSLKLS